MTLRIVAVGKKHDPVLVDSLKSYEKRLNKLFKLNWTMLPYSQQSDNEARGQESENILRHIKPGEYVILLDEQGDMLDSPGLSKLLTNQIESAMDIVFIIGGAYGVDNTVKNRADFIWSLSPLVFPHQLVRLILVEQIYRSQEIYYGRPYHHR